MEKVVPGNGHRQKCYVTVALLSIHARDLKYFWESRESVALYSVLGEGSPKGTVAKTCRITNTVMNMVFANNVRIELDRIFQSFSRH